MNAAIYARYSSDSQREESIEGQLRECREYAERNNMTIVGTYIDRALSAKTADRPEFQHCGFRIICRIKCNSDFRSPLNHSNIIPADIHCCSTSLRPVSITALLQL